MENIFKTTLKKDIISDIVDNNIREIRFPITKFWATRLTDKYSLDDNTFNFKKFDFLELSSPSNKETYGTTHTFDFVRTFVDGDEFIVEFKNSENVESIQDVKNINEKELEQNECGEFIVFDDNSESSDFDVFDVDVNEIYEEIDGSDEEYIDISIQDLYILINQSFEEDNILKSFYEDEFVFATNAKQVIVLPNGKVLGFKKSLPLNNDVEVRIEFDKNEKIYFDEFSDSDSFMDEIIKTLEKIRKNNFIFVWKKYTGIFMDDDCRVYFGIKYTTRKSIGFNRKYNVQ